jgi:hypothetical protein
VAIYSHHDEPSARMRFFYYSQAQRSPMVINCLALVTPDVVREFFLHQSFISV